MCAPIGTFEQLTIDPEEGAPGEPISVEGRLFPNGSCGEDGGEREPPEPRPSELLFLQDRRSWELVAVDTGEGSFNCRLSVPDRATPGPAEITVSGVSRAFTVVEATVAQPPQEPACTLGTPVWSSLLGLLPILLVVVVAVAAVALLAREPGTPGWRP